jgi:hypothetical protein
MAAPRAERRLAGGAGSGRAQRDTFASSSCRAPGLSWFPTPGRFTAGRGALGADYAAAARIRRRQHHVSRVALTIDMSKVASTTARAWWFNPSTGTASLIGDFPTSGARSFTPTTAGDWVLVIDNAGLGLAAPGQ